MSLRFDQIYYFVRRKLAEDIIQELINWISSQDISLWGEDKPRSLHRDMTVLALYKDLYAVGYCRLASDINFGYRITHKSLHHNVSVLRLFFEKWAVSKFILGDQNAWNAEARRCAFRTEVQDSNLWIDSTDFPLQRASRTNSNPQSRTRWSSQ